MCRDPAWVRMGIHTHLRSEWIRTLIFIPWLLEFFVLICYKKEQNRLLLFQVWTLVPVLWAKITGKAERHRRWEAQGSDRDNGALGLNRWSTAAKRKRSILLCMEPNVASLQWEVQGPQHHKGTWKTFKSTWCQILDVGASLVEQTSVDIEGIIPHWFPGFGPQ